MNLIKVKLTTHAQLDAIPLRFGLITDSVLQIGNAQIDNYSTQLQKPVEISDGKQHYIGDAFDLNGVFLFQGRFVLKSIDASSADYLAITVLPVVHSHADRAVSEVVRHQRENGIWSSEFIRDKLHPMYIENKLSNSSDLYNNLVSLGVNVQKEEFQSQLKEYEDIAKEAEERLLLLQLENEKYKKQIADQEKRKLEYSGEGVEVSDLSTLVAVDKVQRTKRDGKRVSCVRLVFLENVPDRIMDVTFDRSGEIFEKAKFLVGSKVRTVTWKPSVYKPLKWFRDIYPAELVS